MKPFKWGFNAIQPFQLHFKIDLSRSRQRCTSFFSPARMSIRKLIPIALSLTVCLVLATAQVPTLPDSVCAPNPPSPAAYQLSLPFSTCGASVRKSLAQRSPDQFKNTSEILETYGYPYKTYNITTEDGYILTVYRITGSPNLDENVEGSTMKQAVLVQHGLSLASDCWNFQPGSRNLPFKLADAGYEVWLGNSRGTSYSMGHTTLNADKDLTYWDFSWNEMGMYDLPAVTDTILKESGNDKIFYIGHSQGATQFLVSASEIPETNNKIKAAFLLAPVAYMGHMNNPIRLIEPFVNTDLGYQITNVLVDGRLPNAQQLRETFHVSIGDMCDLTAAKCGLCDNVGFMLFGYNAPQMNNTELPNFLTKFPNIVSWKCIAHYAQLITACNFQKYDFGAVKNLKVYNSPTPPSYKLEDIKVPLYLFYGDDDNLVPPNDVKITASKLSPGVLKGLIRVEDKLFNHVDFSFAKDADKLLYNRILEEMQNFQ